MMPATALAEPPGVTVVIVNFNGGVHVTRCLECLARQTRLPERIVLVDNASTDGSLAACRGLVAREALLADRTTIDETGRNLGFAAASNRGIAAAATELVALLNPDAFPAPAWLEALVNAAVAHPECVAFGSRQMLADRPGVLDGIGDRWHFSGLTWREGHGRPLRSADLEPREIFSPCAAAALYRRDAVVEVGGLDDDYFCYVEDVDLGFRLRLAGHRARYVPDAVVDHVGGASSPGVVATYLGHRNLVWTLVKDTPGLLLPIAVVAHVAQAVVAVPYLCLRGRGRAFLRAKWDAAKGIAGCWRKRRTIQAVRRISAWHLAHAMDFLPFRLGR